MEGEPSKASFFGDREKKHDRTKGSRRRAHSCSHLPCHAVESVSEPGPLLVIVPSHSRCPILFPTAPSTVLFPVLPLHVSRPPESCKTRDLCGHKLARYQKWEQLHCQLPYPRHSVFLRTGRGLPCVPSCLEIFCGDVPQFQTPERSTSVVGTPKPPDVVPRLNGKTVIFSEA